MPIFASCSLTTSPVLSSSGYCGQAEVLDADAVREPGLLHLGLGLGQVGLGVRRVGRRVPDGAGRHLEQPVLAGAVVGDGPDLGAVDRVGDGLPQRHVVEGLRADVQCEVVGDAGELRPQQRQLRILRERRELLQRHGVDPVELARVQRVDAALVDEQEVEHDAVERRLALLEVAREALQRDVVALLPLDELERPGPDGLALGALGLDRALVDDLAVVREVRQERAERGRQVERDPGRRVDLDLLDRRVQRRVAARGLRVRDPLERVLDVVRGEGVAVVELDARRRGRRPMSSGSPASSSSRGSRRTSGSRRCR